MNQVESTFRGFPFIGYWSDKGRVRAENEDRFYVPPAHLSSQLIAGKGYLILVADGMGGHAKGEVASDMAARRIAELYYADADPDVEQSLRRAIIAANAEIFSAAQNPEMTGMGTTLTAAVALGNRVVVANVGDSRAYLVSNGRAQQLTRDHTWVQDRVEEGILTQEQAEQHMQRNVITRALGIKPHVEVDFSVRDVSGRDALLLCSDGLSNLVRTEEIARAVSAQSPMAAAQHLGALANNRGGHDNITVIAMPVAANAATAQRAPSSSIALPIALASVSALVLAFLAALAIFIQPPLQSQSSANVTTIVVTSVPSPTSALVIVPPTSTPPIAQAKPPVPAPTATHTLTPTPIPTPLPTAIPVMPRGDVSYTLRAGESVNVLTSLFMPGNRPDAWTFYNRHPEIWCAPTGGNFNCIKNSAILNLKFDELNPPPVDLLTVQQMPGKTVWLAIHLDDSSLTVGGLGGLKDYKNRWALVRGIWQPGQFIIEPANFVFVWHEQTSRYYLLGQAPASPTSPATNQVEKEKKESGDSSQPAPEVPVTK